MDKKEEIIGISAQSPADAWDSALYIGKITGHPVINFDSSILDFMQQLTGIKLIKNSDQIDSYLGKEWSYVRQEKFTEKGTVVFKPIRYYLTAKQVFTKLKYNLREIHSDIWVNHFFNTHEGSMILPIQYPNQADAIVERGGIIVRITNPLYYGSREETIMDNYPCTHTVEINKLSWPLKDAK